jgi:hypothetical protein
VKTTLEQGREVCQTKNLPGVFNTGLQDESEEASNWLLLRTPR